MSFQERAEELEKENKELRTRVAEQQNKIESAKAIISDFKYRDKNKETETGWSKVIEKENEILILQNRLSTVEARLRQAEGFQTSNIALKVELERHKNESEKDCHLCRHRKLQGEISDLESRLSTLEKEKEFKDKLFKIKTNLNLKLVERNQTLLKASEGMEKALRLGRNFVKDANGSWNTAEGDLFMGLSELALADFRGLKETK